MLKAFRDSWQNRSWARGFASATAIWGTFLFLAGTAGTFIDPFVPELPVGTVAAVGGGAMLACYTAMTWIDLRRPELKEGGPPAAD